MGVKYVHIGAEGEQSPDLSEVPALRSEVQCGWLLFHIVRYLLEPRARFTILSPALGGAHPPTSSMAYGLPPRPS